MELKGKKVAVLVENMYQELEVWYPLLRLREAGAETFTVGKEAGKTYTSKVGYPVVADRAWDSVSAGELDALVVPGGYAPDILRRYPEVLKLVRDVDAAGKVVAAICHAGWVLCSAGILKGRRATCVSAIKDDLVNAGARYADEEVVVDGNLVTSRIPTDLPAFCREIIRVLAAGALRPREHAVPASVTR
jgi:protease I